jgi:Protein of unknown function (DUF1569)
MPKSIFDEANYMAIARRLENLTPHNAREWGKMDVAQMLAHCSVSLEQAMGKVPFVDESNFFTKTVIKWVVLRMIRKKNMNRGTPTAKSLVVADPRVFDQEKQRLLVTIKDFYDAGLTRDIGLHPAFGKMTNEEWGTLQYLHLDHHLKQFSA